VNHHSTGQPDAILTEEVGAWPHDAEAAAGLTCTAWRDTLESRTLQRLSESRGTRDRSDTPAVDPATAVITLDLAGYLSAEQAEAAESSIDWFSRQDEDLARQRACRSAFA